MKPASFILVSPGPIDGYPPVQYQARLLADAGYPVTLVTTPLQADAPEPEFSHVGVDVRSISTASAFGGRMARMMHYARVLWGARRSHSSDTVEIVYDPVGCFYSDLVPAQPKWRIAHFHELLQDYESAYFEKRLRVAIRNYDLVVVPDASRGLHTQRVLGLANEPLTIENFPLRAASPPVGSAGSRSPRFEVIYCGTLGLHQKLDCVIRSVPKWPEHADLVLIGNDCTQTAIHLRRLAAEIGVEDRVHFVGWLNTPDAEARLAQADLGLAFLDTSFEQWRTALTASNKRFQYMKAGLPQIGDANPGVPELLDGIGSCIRSDHDPEEIAALVSAYVHDAARCAAEGERAFACHWQRYNYERAFQPLLDLVTTW